MRKWIALLIAFGLLLPTAYVHADRVKGAFQSLDATDNVTTAKVVTGTLNVSGAPTFADNTVNGADLVDNTVPSSKILDNSIASGKILDNTIALAKIASSGTKDNTTFLRGDGVWSAKEGRGALVHLSTNQSIDNNTATAINFDTTDDYDTDGIHNPSGTDNTKLIVPSGVTKVRLSGRAIFEANATGFRTLYIDKGGTPSFVGGSYMTEEAPSGSTFTRMQVSTAIIPVNAGDVFKLYVLQTSGSTLTVYATDTWFSMEIIQ